MAIAFVGKMTPTAATSTNTFVTGSYASTTGNTLILCIQHQTSDIASVTDSAGNTWTKAADSIDLAATSQRRVGVWYCINANAITSVTVTGSTFTRIFLYEYSGIAAFRAGASSISSATNPPAAAPAGVVSGDLVVGCIGYNQTTTGTRFDTLNSGLGYTEQDSFDNGGLPRMSSAASIRTSSGASGPTWTMTQGTTGSASAAFSATAIVNNPPTADAGANQTNIEPYTTVTLDGSASSDSDGTVTTYTWVQTAGSPTVTLSGTGATRTFTAPGTIAGTTLTFGLTVKDNSNNNSTQDTTTVTVYPVTERAVVGGVEVPAQITAV